MPERKKPFTVKTLAEHWSCSQDHIRDLITAGKLECFRLGHLIRILAEEVERIECGSSCTEDLGAPSGEPIREPSVSPFARKTVILPASASRT